MLIRTISGAVYVAISVGFFVLRQLVDYRLFSILLWFFCAVGTMEVARAIKGYTDKFIFTLNVCFGALFVPVYALFNYLVTPFYGYLAGLSLIMLFVIILEIYMIIKNRGVKAFFISVLPVIYPAIFILSMLVANDVMPIFKGYVATLLIFVIAPCADTFAYLVGMTYNKIKKGNAKKLCPNLSPKKTVAGAIGGLVGGTLGSLIVYFIYSETLSVLKIPFYIFIIVGIIGSILTEIGDLFESGIKRKVGIKDMGKIMPGHGGVMDRIDGTSFASALICILFLII